MTKHFITLLAFTALSGCNSTARQPDAAPTESNTEASPNLPQGADDPHNQPNSTSWLQSKKASCDGEEERQIVTDIAKKHPAKLLRVAAADHYRQTRKLDLLVKPNDADRAEYTVQQIRIQSHDENLNNEVCDASLVINIPDYGSGSIPIRIKVERTTDGEPFATVYGLQ